MFENAYLALIKDNRIFEGSLQDSASHIAKQSALALSVGRASVWVSYDDESVLHCLSLYNVDQDSYEHGTILRKKNIPRYFEALNNERVVNTANALEDPRTRELKSSYLIPLDIHSLLDATLRSKGKLKGVLCLEMIGCQRDWTKDEEMFVASVADLISQRLIVDELAKSEKKYKSLYESTSEGIAIFGGDKFADVNSPLCNMFLGSRDEFIGLTPIDLSPKFQEDGQLSTIKGGKFRSECLRGNPQNFEWKHKRLDGTEFFAEIALNPVTCNGENTMFALFRDITDRKVAEEQATLAKENLMFRAAHDSLTGLKNREQLHKCIDSLTSKDSAENGFSKIALLLLDLNRFKEVNDTLGHATGDKVLVKLAEILNKQVSKIGGILFRLGGDEFVAVFNVESCTEKLEKLESLLHECLKFSFNIDDVCIEMSASIGVALYPKDGKDSHELLRCADVAMYHAKNNDGVSSWYDLQNDLNNKRRLAMIVELNAGINQDQLLLHFQPRIHLKTGKVCGCEALVRWQHPVHGLIQPDEFIPTAEMSNAIHSLSEWVLNGVIKQVKRLIDKNFYVPVAMNISARNLSSSHLVDKLESILETENIDPRLFEIEITESALIDDPQRASQNLDRMDRLGISIAIDDYGKGYSSLSYLKKLPLDTLKIDRSFVTNLLNDGSDSVIVDSTIQLAHNFSLKVVAEGVENLETLDELAAINCDQAQGFFIARPMTADAFEVWLEKNLCHA